MHSFGGLVVKQMLRAALDSSNDDWKQIAAQTRGIAFLATPHAGSRLADWVRRIPFYRGTVTVSELEQFNPQLKDLGDWFRNYYRTSKIKAVVYTETRNVKGIRVVHDGDPYLPGVDAVPLDDSHVSITKPKSKQSQLYRGISRFLRDCLNAVSSHDITLEAAAGSLAIIDNAHPQVGAVAQDHNAGPAAADSPTSESGPRRGLTGTQGRFSKSLARRSKNINRRHTIDAYCYFFSERDSLSHVEMRLQGHGSSAAADG